MASKSTVMGQRRAVLACGGWMHPSEEPERAITAMVEARGFDATVVTDPVELAAELSEGCGLLVVAACWFSMTQERYSAPDREAWGVGPDQERQAALAAVIDAGCPVLALHTAVICFDQWPGWGERLGGRWDWDQSHHPPPGELDITGVEDAALTIDPFSVVDEEYQGLALADRSQVIARTSGGNPVMWLNGDAGRRVAVDVLGHDYRSLNTPGHRAALDQLLDWLLEPTSPGP